MERLRELGVVVGKGGLAGNVLRIKPPLCLGGSDVDFALDALDSALRL
jgi:alanine-glyoxylate transaminase/(R)-3-amino-2-methylpropionate-pyruvate transaminase